MIQAYGISSVGRVRQHNEDAMYADQDGWLFLVADGMGGQELGAEASRSVVEIIPAFFRGTLTSPSLNDITLIASVSTEVGRYWNMIEVAIEHANTHLYNRNKTANINRAMGTTVVGLLFLPMGEILVFNIGDSRLYRLRDEKLSCLTTDHSVYAEWIAAGRVGPQPKRNIITRAVGPFSDVKADIMADRFRSGDHYLLCSDGLHGLLDDAGIEAILRQRDGSLKNSVEHLIVEANQAGGRDNITAILCHVS